MLRWPMTAARVTENSRHVHPYPMSALGELLTLLRYVNFEVQTRVVQHWLQHRVLQVQVWVPTLVALPVLYAVSTPLDHS